MVYMAKSVYIIDNLIRQITHVHASDPIIDLRHCHFLSIHILLIETVKT